MRSAPSSIAAIRSFSDLLVGLNTIVFCPSVHERKLESFKQFLSPFHAHTLATTIQAKLHLSFPEDIHVSVDEIAPALVDISIIGRKGVEILEMNLPDNRRCAYVGDSYLTLHVAEQSYKSSYTPEQFQNLRTSVTSKTHLAYCYDQILGSDCDILRNQAWIDPLSQRQKAEFIEAILGALYDAGNKTALKAVCQSIVRGT
jgi:hypothetical protein